MVRGDDAESIGALLEAAGAWALRFEEASGPALYDEAQGGDPRYWPSTRLAGFFASHAAADFAEYVLGGHHGPIRRDTVDDDGWETAVLKDWAPTVISPRLAIFPSGQVAPAGGIVVTLDPGLAFGTGTHPTTRLCLERIEDIVMNDAPSTVLDFGCGSGILAICALRLGVPEATAVDSDPWARAATEANAARNGVQTRLKVAAVAATGTYALVVANILARPLVALAPQLTARTAATGWLLLAGLLDHQADWVAAAYPEFVFTPISADGWCLLAGRRA